MSRGSLARRLALVWIAAVLAGVQLEAGEAEPHLVLEQIPGDGDHFDTMQPVGIDPAESPFRPGQVVHVWNGSDSSSQQVTIARIQVDRSNEHLPRLVIQYDRKMSNAGASAASHLCPRPGLNRSMSRSVDRRGHVYQLASLSPFPAQTWRCGSLSGSEMDQLSRATHPSADEWTGYTKIVSGKNEVLYQISRMSPPCRTLFAKRTDAGFAPVRESSDCNLEPFVDVDGDGMPEFIAPSSDGADTVLKRIFPTEKDLAAYSTGQ